MQAWIRTIIPSLFACYAANRHQRLIMFFELFKVLRSLSVLWTLGFASLCQHNSPIRYASWAKHSLWLELWVIGYGYWLLAIGYGLWTGACGVATIHASNLSSYRPFPAKGSVLTQLPKADVWAVRSSAGQNRWSVRQNIICSTEGREIRWKVRRTYKIVRRTL